MDKERGNEGWFRRYLGTRTPAPIVLLLARRPPPNPYPYPALTHTRTRMRCTALRWGQRRAPDCIIPRGTMVPMYFCTYHATAGFAGRPVSPRSTEYSYLPTHPLRQPLPLSSFVSFSFSSLSSGFYSSPCARILSQWSFGFYSLAGLLLLLLL